MPDTPIRFLIDENVRSDVASLLAERGHQIILSRDVIAMGSPDELLVVLGKFESLVIVTHDRDFRKYRRMLPDHLRKNFSSGAGRLLLGIQPNRSLIRIEEEIESVEFHYRQAVRAGRPFLMEIMDANIKIQTR
jgi:hypothetical protein